MEFTVMVPTSWKIITKKKELFERLDECVAKAKLDDLQANYFAKQRKHWAEEQEISTLVKGKEGKDNGARSGRKQQVYTPFLEKN